MIARRRVAALASLAASFGLGLGLGTQDAARQLLELIFAPAATGYPSFMGPHVPAERVAAIRAAYKQALADPELAELLRREKLDLDPIDGADVARIVDRIYDMPQSVVDRARDLIPPL
jgi:hypothetical protein